MVARLKVSRNCCLVFMLMAFMLGSGRELALAEAIAYALEEEGARAGR